MSETFHKVVAAQELEDKTISPFIVNGWPVLLCREDGKVSAVINRCTHAAAPFAPGGRVRRGAVMCPLHGARFRLDTGECMGGVSYKPLLVFAVRESEDGWIEVAVPDEAPGAEHLPVIPLV